MENNVEVIFQEIDTTKISILCKSNDKMELIINKYCTKALKPKDKCIFKYNSVTIKNDATKTGNLFCGWYTEQNGGGTKINDVSQLAALGDNPSLYAWFLDEKENHTVSQVELSGVAKVGEILTATPKYGSDAFEGVVSYQWYYSDTNSSAENDWRAIEGASNGTYTIDTTGAMD